MKIKSLIFLTILAGLILTLLFNCKKEEPKVAPIIATPTISEITATTITCIVAIGTDGGVTITSKGVSWSTILKSTTTDNKTNNGGGTGSFTSIITGLTPGTTYYIKAYAINSVGTGYSSQLKATTLLSLPALTTLAVTPGIRNTAITGGNITDDGGTEITARGVCWSINQNPTIADKKSIDGSGTGSYNSSIEGITYGITYYCRAYSTTAGGTNYGNQITFNIPSGLPVVYTTSLPIPTVVNGNVISEGSSSVTERGFCWSTSKNPSINDSKTSSGTGAGTFSGSIPLSHSRETEILYVRAYATNSIGTAYGDQFATTLDCALLGLYLYDIDKYKNRLFPNSSSPMKIWPKFSSDSKKVYYNIGTDFYSMDLDGSGEILESHNLQPYESDLSPDNQLITYAISGKLFLMNKDGSNAHQLTNSLSCSSPRWSRDGQKIACGVNSGNGGVCYVTLNGIINVMSNVTIIGIGSYSWSSDSKSIAYCKTDAGGKSQIYKYDLVSSSEVKLTSLSSATRPIFSPVGNKIAFNQGNNIMVMNADGSNQRTIYDRSIANSPAWSPDGNKIAFVTGDNNIGVIDVNGNNFHVINEIPGACWAPIWSPDGKYILYGRNIIPW